MPQESVIVNCMTTDSGAELQLDNGDVLQIRAITPEIVRVRLASQGNFAQSGLDRYGFVRTDWPPVDCQLSDEAERIVVHTGSLNVEVQKSPPVLRFSDSSGGELLQELEPGQSSSEGFATRFGLAPDEQFFGFGDQTRQRIQHRGHLARMWIVNVHGYTPIPFFMSTRGYGIFVNSTWRHTFNMGAASDEWYGFAGPQGQLDYFFIYGPELPTLLRRYTEITGKPYIPPLWSFGLWFVCNMRADAREMLDDCYKFRAESIPCDIIALEPGWMETFYDFSVDKKWHPERFHIPSYGQISPDNFLGAARRMGFKPSLWLCCDYDVSAEEERRLEEQCTQQPSAESSLVEEVSSGYEVDEHLIAPVLMDKTTRPDEAWFEHLKPFVDQGVELFKQDGSNQVLEHPDRKWANGMDDEEMHNLYPLLYSKQMHQGFREHTGRRATCFTPCGYAGLQRYTGTWAGDTGGGGGSLVSMLNLSLSGHSLMTCDMDTTSKEGIHFGFLQPWVQLCSWNYWKHPWLLGDELGPIFKDYVRLRYAMLPYIYSTAHQAYRTGMPILRAMPLAFPEDNKCRELLTQYMLGEAFLVSAFTDEVYLPTGQWTDYWTGEAYEGGQSIKYEPPANRGGGLFVRAGAIIPLAPVMDYVGQKPWDPITLDIYPSAPGEFTLIEDDGISYDYESGVVAETHFSCQPGDDGILIHIGVPSGSYEGLPANRGYVLTVHVPEAPREVLVDSQPLPAIETMTPDASGWTYRPDEGLVEIHLRGRADGPTAIEILSHP